MNWGLFILGVVGLAMFVLLALVASIGVSVNIIFILQSAGVGVLVSAALLAIIVKRWWS